MTEETKTPAEKAAAAEDKEQKLNSIDAQKRYESDIAKWKSEFRATKEELESTKIQAEKEKSELLTRAEEVEKSRKAYEDKYIDSELKAEAIAAGIKDIEFVKLIDKNEIKLDEKGNVTGIDKAIADVKTRKPQWFGEEKKTSTSTGAKFPEKTGEPKKVDARTMSKEDYQKQRSTYMAGHFG